MALSLSRRFVSPVACAVVFLLAPSLALHGQDDPSPPDPASATASLSGVITAPAAPRDVSPMLLPMNFLKDQEKMWAFPYKLAQGRSWAPTITVAAATFALLSADPHVEPYFHGNPAFRGFNHVFSSKITSMETIAIPTALFAIGYGRHDSYMQKTALFAAEAVADSEVIRSVLNSVTTRWRPADITPPRNYGDTFFHSRSRIGSSFPSGHTIAAVAVATVIARRYRDHRWVPIVSPELLAFRGLPCGLTSRPMFSSEQYSATLSPATTSFTITRGNPKSHLNGPVGAA